MYPIRNADTIGEFISTKHMRIKEKGTPGGGRTGAVLDGETEP
jgi:hypothetical protein